MSLTLFVGGIHGVGKSTFSRELCTLIGASHVTAGELIRENATGMDRLTIGGKAVPSVDANQRLLLRGLELYRARVAGPILLDGHFALLGPTGGILEIPVAVYEAIAPAGVILIEAKLATVHARLLKRDGTAPPEVTLAELAKGERSNAERVCAHLGISLWAACGDASPHEAAASVAPSVRVLLGGVA
ncbi:MAG: ATP-binding protein [Vicinamibacteria bacterium]